MRVVTISLKDIISRQRVKDSKSKLTFEEVYAFGFQVLGFSVLVGRENTNLVVLIEGDVDINFSWLHNLF